MFEVFPFRGVGPLIFGMTRAEVLGLLSDPSSITSDDPGRETWAYESLALTLYFDADDDWRFESLEVSHPNTRLCGVPVFRRPHLAVLTDLANAGLAGAISRPFDDDEEELYFDHASLHLWREGQCFTSLSLGVPTDSSDRHVWPSEESDA
jgi:hypothetical protein